MQDLEQIIRERAYHLWDANGRHEGEAEAHWLTAQGEILALSMDTVASVSVSQSTAKTAKKPGRRSARKLHK